VQRVLAADYTPEDALRGGQFDPEEVWTKGSVAAMRVALPGLWLAAYACLSAYIAAFIMFRRRSVAGAPAGPGSAGHRTGVPAADASKRSE
jgi:hypothetical protein